MAEARPVEQAKRDERAAEAAPPADVFPAMGGLSPEAVIRANEAMGRGLTAIGQEVNRFVWKRLQADLEVCQSLLACREVETATQVERDFLETAMTQYAEESRTLADIAAAMFRDSMPATEATRH